MAIKTLPVLLYAHEDKDGHIILSPDDFSVEQGQLQGLKVGDVVQAVVVDISASSLPVDVPTKRRRTLRRKWLARPLVDNVAAWIDYLRST